MSFGHTTPNHFLGYSFYYYFYESTREAILGRRAKGASQALSTLESMIAGSSSKLTCTIQFLTLKSIIGTIAGSATSILVNPIWVVQTTQAVQTLPVTDPSSSTDKPKVVKKMGLIETVQFIIRKGGIGALWRGIGPALVLVLNPIIQASYLRFQRRVKTNSYRF